MKISLPILALALLAFCRASAQVVSVGVVLNQEQFLPGESLPVAVCITNNSGQTLHLGADPDWLTFSVESKDGFIVIKNSEVPVPGKFDLGSSEVSTTRVDLQPYFDLKRQGHYTVTATLHIKDWSAHISSPPKGFDVVSGGLIWSQVFGVPVPPGVTNRQPEERKYILEQANYLHDQLRMYVVVSDESGSHMFKASAICPMVSFSQPEEQLDQFSNLHVICQSGMRAFTYSVVSPDGEILRQDVYDYLYNNIHPRLGTNDAGEITVIGGVRRVKPDQLPAAKLPDELPPPAKP